MRKLMFSFIFCVLSFPLFAAEQLVVLYTTSWCGHCKSVKTYLDNLHIEYTNYDIGTSDIAQQKYQALHGIGVPLIFVGNRRIDGFNKAALEAALKDHGLIAS